MSTTTRELNMVGTQTIEVRGDHEDLPALLRAAAAAVDEYQQANGPVTVVTIGSGYEYGIDQDGEKSKSLLFLTVDL